MSIVMSQPSIMQSPMMKLAPAQLAELVREHQADVWRYLRYLGATTADADDLTQETFLAVARAQFSEQSPQQTAAYLRTVARNQLLMARRRENHQISTVALAAAEQVWSTLVSETGSSVLLAALVDCLEKLEGRARAAIDGFYRDRRSREELAYDMNMKPDGVKTLLRRTREVLRNCIEKRM
ncbi:RNA polymerase sigma factor [Bythopirellula polymerisocia]|uniref:ECF RNA polymerase sigma factor SigE n=1 Tax=Bythopirellula polymerisocia TaxID=2528003 RepID=A0A5C6CDI1_9BACT|nr:sigma-70 family RNA polymerase sigma factor [Bythopirellula polymerisocia]TWU22640.1 ECF RNA polymerase sigma factor SigE [Bythopirellula polymerisocia]